MVSSGMTNLWLLSYGVVLICCMGYSLFVFATRRLEAKAHVAALVATAGTKHVPAPDPPGYPHTKIAISSVHCQGIVAVVSGPKDIVLTSSTSAMKVLPSRRACQECFELCGRPSLLAYERSCTTFRALLAEDEMWRYCCKNEEKADCLSYRECAFVYRIFERINASQARGDDDNMILDVFGGAIAFTNYVSS